MKRLVLAILIVSVIPVMSCGQDSNKKSPGTSAEPLTEGLPEILAGRPAEALDRILLPRPSAGSRSAFWPRPWQSSKPGPTMSRL